MTEAQFYYEVAYELSLATAGPRLSDALERPKGSGVRRTSFQWLDDAGRRAMHPSHYEAGPKDSEKPYNAASDHVIRALGVGNLVGLGLTQPTEHWLGSFMTMVHAIETTFHVNTLLRTLSARYRPRSVYRDGVDYHEAPRNSFPSGHGSQAFAYATTAVLVLDLEGAWAWGAWSAATVASFLRIPGGQHFVTDLIGGAVVGVALPHAVYHTLHSAPKSSQFGWFLSPRALHLHWRF